jgi:hypothetical protein
MTSPQSLPATMRPAPLLSILSTAALLISIVGLVFLLHLGTQPNADVVFVTPFVIFIGLAPARRDWLLVFAFSAALAIGYPAAGGGIESGWIAHTAEIGAVLGCGSLATMGVIMLWSEGERGVRARFGFKQALILPVFGMLGGLIMPVFWNRPATTFDLHLYSFDDRFGFQASFWLGRIFARSAWIHNTATVVYMALPAMPAIVAAAAWRQRRNLPFDPLISFVIGGALCLPFFQICPGAGPKYAFPGVFPFHAPEAWTLAISRIAIPEAPRNAIPSMHVTWTLLAYWCARPLSRWVHVFAGMFLTWTVLATLGLGEHYFCDLIVGCAFALFISALACRLPLSDPRRREALVFGAVVTVGWLLLLRTAALIAIPRAGAWALAVGTVAGSAWLGHRLIAATQTRAGHNLGDDLPQKEGGERIPPAIAEPACGTIR